MALPGFVSSGRPIFSLSSVPSSKRRQTSVFGHFPALPGCVTWPSFQIQRVERDSLPPPNESFSNHIKGVCIQGWEEFIPVFKIYLMKKSAICSA